MIKGNFFSKLFQSGVDADTTTAPGVRSRGNFKGKTKESLTELLATLFVAFSVTMVVRIFFFDPFHVPSGSMMPTLLSGDKMFVKKFAYGYNKHSLPKKIIPFKGRIFGKNPKRGDVIVFALPSNEDIFYVKRVVAVEGDSVQVMGGMVYINGLPNEQILLKSIKIFDQKDEYSSVRSLLFEHKGGIDSNLEYDALKETSADGKSYKVLMPAKKDRSSDMNKTLVPKGTVFVMGDNRSHSLDSRFKEVGFVPLENIVGKAVIIFFSSDGGMISLLSDPNKIRIERMLKTID